MLEIWPVIGGISHVILFIEIKLKELNVRKF